MDSSPRFFLSKKEEYFHLAQVDFDFGQVHIVWWLSYCQVEEKITVEPCNCLWIAVLLGSGQTNDDVTSLMQICHNNNSNNNYNSNANQYFLA